MGDHSSFRIGRLLQSKNHYMEISACGDSDTKPALLAKVVRMEAWFGHQHRSFSKSSPNGSLIRTPTPLF